MPNELRGRTILLTRQARDSASLIARLAPTGAEILSLPCIRVEHLQDLTRLRDAVRALRPSDWLLLTSRHGVDAVLRAVPRAEIRARVAVPGPATAEHARQAGFEPWRPSRMFAAGIARELPLGGRVLWARADIAADGPWLELRARGFDVADVVAYRTVPGVDGDASDVRRRFERSTIDVVVFFSPSAVDGLLAVVPGGLVARARPVASGSTTGAHIRARIGREPVVAERAGIAWITRAIERATEPAHAHA